MKSSPSIWHCQIDGEDFVIFVALLENMNFSNTSFYYNKLSMRRKTSFEYSALDACTVYLRTQLDNFLSFFN